MVSHHEAVRDVTERGLQRVVGAMAVILPLAAHKGEPIGYAAAAMGTKPPGLPGHQRRSEGASAAGGHRHDLPGSAFSSSPRRYVQSRMDTRAGVAPRAGSP